MTLNVGGVSRATSPNLGDSKGLTLNRPCTRGRAVIDDRQGSAEFPEPEVEPRSEGDAEVARRRNRRRQSLASGHLRSEAPATPSELSRASVTTAITERVIHGSCRSAGVTMGPAESRATNSVAANGDAGQQAESTFVQGGPSPWLRRARGLRERRCGRPDWRRCRRCRGWPSMGRLKMLVSSECPR